MSERERETKLASKRAISVLHGQPTVDELLDAVEELMRGPLLDEVSDISRLQLRVAANVVAIVRRELEHGVADEAWYRESLARFGFADDAELASAIREGRIDADQYPAVIDLVRSAVRRRVDVTHPGYRKD